MKRHDGEPEYQGLFDNEFNDIEISYDHDDDEEGAIILNNKPQPRNQHKPTPPAATSA
jgi:hypothetical protein